MSKVAILASWVWRLSIVDNLVSIRDVQPCSQLRGYYFFYFVLIFFFIVIPSVNIEGIFLSVKSLGNLSTKIFSRYFHLYLSIFW
jgi:hypothetical protein